MKRAFKFSITIFIGIVIIYGCKLGTSPEEGPQNKAGTVTITGQVVDSTSGAPIEGARVSLSFGGDNQTIETKPDGTFEADITIAENVDLWMEITSPNYQRYLVTEFLTAGSFIDFGRIIMQKKESAIEASGGASSIVMFSQSAVFIHVAESGANEVANLTFEVQDSSGIPVDNDHKVTVNF